MILAISGKPRSGKDGVCLALLERFGGRRFAFADKLKEQLVRAVFELTGEVIDPWNDKSGPIGPMLQVYGTDVMRRYRSTIWIDYLFKFVLSPWVEEHPDELAIITDCRFPNEADLSREKGAFLIRLERDHDKRIADVVRLDGEKGLDRETHEVENALDDYQGFDVTCYDNPMPVVVEQVTQFLIAKGMFPSKAVILERQPYPTDGHDSTGLRPGVLV